MLIYSCSLLAIISFKPIRSNIPLASLDLRKPPFKVTTGRLHSIEKIAEFKPEKPIGSRYSVDCFNSDAKSTLLKKGRNITYSSIFKPDLIKILSNRSLKISIK